jgi:glycerol-3-phosphate O-acyltransferase
MVRELSATPSPEIIQAIEPLADTLVRQVYTGIDVDEEGIERVREAARRGTIVLLPSHKSHVDYLILSYVLKKHMLELPLIASGDNLSFFPVGPVLRRGGAFFIRRSFRGDKLYAAIVDAYVRRVIRDGWAIEFFLEGGRSRTGKLLPPQVGLLNLVVDAALELETRPVAFVPISIVYERTMEEVELVREKAGAPKERESARSLLAVGEALLERYGRVNVQFGRVIDLASFRADIGIESGTLTPAKRRSLVMKLAQGVMSEINRVTAVTAGSLVATALLDMEGRGLGHIDLVARCSRLLHTAMRSGARPARTLTIAGSDGPVLREASIREATLLFIRSGLVKQHVPDDTLERTPSRRERLYAGQDVVYTVPDESRARLDLAKNSIIHFFVDRSIVGLALLGIRSRRSTRKELLEQANKIDKLFEHEFAFRSMHSATEALEAVIDDMVAFGELALHGEEISFGPGALDLDGASACRSHARHLESYLDAYRITARTLRVLVHGALAQKDFVTRTLAVGRQMFLGGEINRREAVSRPTIENALLAFADAGFIKKSLEKVELTERYAGENNVRKVEAEIASYQAGLVRRDS